jgi:hypothetical protein
VHVDGSPRLSGVGAPPIGQSGRAIAAYINEPPEDSNGANARMLILPYGSIVCRALSDIAAGDEIFMHYGENYQRDYAVYQKPRTQTQTQNY